MTGNLTRREEMQRQTHTKRKMPCEDRTEAGILQLQAKEQQGLLATTRS